jgi:hypothetical protein
MDVSIFAGRMIRSLKYFLYVTRKHRLILGKKLLQKHETSLNIVRDEKKKLDQIFNYCPKTQCEYRFFFIALEHLHSPTSSE